MRSNPFQVGEDDAILPSTKDVELKPMLEPYGTKDMELDPDGNELVAEEELEGKEQLEAEEHHLSRAEKEYGKGVI
ncbi:hypothetical protein KYD79_27225, partial [Escherichia coli]|nr:hypothetical protein [Escherichia coli]